MRWPPAGDVRRGTGEPSGGGPFLFPCERGSPGNGTPKPCQADRRRRLLPASAATQTDVRFTPDSAESRARPRAARQRWQPARPPWQDESPGRVVMVSGEIPGPAGVSPHETATRPGLRPARPGGNAGGAAGPGTEEPPEPMLPGAACCPVYRRVACLLTACHGSVWPAHCTRRPALACASAGVSRGGLSCVPRCTTVTPSTGAVQASSSSSHVHIVITCLRMPRCHW